MDYLKTAKGILANIGGQENINQLSHCYTRLRFNLKDQSIVNTQAIKDLEGILDVVEASGQFQVVVGPQVDKVYKEIMGLTNLQHNDHTDNKPKEKLTVKSAVNKVLDIFIGCFTPIIPVIAGCGMIKVLCAVLLTLGILTAENSTYQILSFVGDSVFYFLPLFVGYTAAKKMDTDPFIGMVLGAILLHPNFSAMGADGATYTSFLTLPVRIASYSAQALPVILCVWVMKYINNFAEKVSPSIVKVFLRPMITILVMVPIMLVVVGPLGAILGDYFQGFCDVMNQWGWIAVGLNAAIFPFLVLTGMHNALIPLMIQMFATQGFDPVLVPSGLVANIAEGGAAFGVFMKSKNKGVKGTALSASVSALFGITEPALYGVNLRFKKPFIMMLIGSLVGGCLAGLMGVTAYSFVSPSIVSLPIFAGKGSSFIWAIISAIFTFIFTAIITWLFGYKDEKGDDHAVKSPMTGKVIPLTEVNDAAFASESMGKGFAIIPENGQVVAPFDGEVVALFPTKHAIGLKRVDGLEILIHVGIDSVNLNGEGYEAFVKVGDFVKANDLLLKVDLNVLKEHSVDSTTPVIVTNSHDYQTIQVKNVKTIQSNEAILDVR